MKKIIFLNALVTSSRTPMTLRTSPVSLEEVRELVKGREIVSYIGHEATASLLTRLLGVSVPMNRSMYDPRPGDIAVVVRLKKRLEKPEDVQNVSESDVEFILVEYHEF
jgi:hypothetical protein